MSIEVKEIPNITVGTKIIYIGDIGHLSITAVERITNTMLILKNGVRIYKKNGNIVGRTAYSKARVEVATAEREQEVKIEIQRRNIIKKLKGCDFDNLSLETLKKIYINIKEGEEKNGN